MLVHFMVSLLILYHLYLLPPLSDIDVWVPEPDHSEVPAAWWDFDADKSLLIGVFKHGK